MDSKYNKIKNKKIKKTSRIIYIKFETEILKIKSAIYILTIKKNRKPRHQLEKKICQSNDLFSSNIR